MSISKLHGLLPLLTLALISGLVGCTNGEARRGRVLLVGIDGATLRVAKPLIDDGKLPNLAMIARNGVSGPLRSAQPMASPRIWNSIATGKTPKKHGILSFAYRTGGKEKQLYLSTDRKVHALWNIASDAGLTVGVVNFWNTYPPEKIRGVMVSDHFLARQIKGRQKIARSGAAPEGPLVFPRSWHEKILALLGQPEAITSVENPFLDGNQLPWWVPSENLSRNFQEDGLLLRVAREIEAQIRPDLLMVLFTGIDRVSHVLWGTIEPPELSPEILRGTPAARKAGAAALRQYYEYTDALIGELLRSSDPKIS
jgi:predicted AlkP superfamily phosphohydrolase/phosphomutase